MNLGDEVDVVVEDVAFGGDGVARVNGAVVFVPFTALGDRVTVKIIKSGKRFARGLPVACAEEGPGRVVPECRYFGACGGCQYQHLDYATELKVKEKQVRDVLTRIGGVGNVEVSAIYPSPVPYGYRNRITVHRQDGRLGFHAIDGRTVVDIDRCAIASDAVNDRLTKLRSTGLARDHYSVREPGLEMEVFYQTNRFLADSFQKLVVEQVPASASGVVDAYCGTGFFTHPLSRRVGSVVGIESNARAAELARREVGPGTTILVGEVEVRLVEAREILAEGSVVLVVDPPREGLSARVKELVGELDWARVIYVSCNPATLARDLKELRPIWVPTQVTPIDLFPRTAQVECVAVLDRSIRS
ncbi:MAG: hypothetical protein OHK005_05520 [Candidatus Methylacidiphilales bacterium]